MGGLIFGGHFVLALAHQDYYCIYIDVIIITTLFQKADVRKEIFVSVWWGFIGEAYVRGALYYITMNFKVLILGH